MLRLPFDAPVEKYEVQAADLLANRHAASDEPVQTLADAQLAVARWYSFRDWLALVEWVSAVTRADSPVARFESAVEAVIAGDAPKLKRQLDEHPTLVSERSTILTRNQPP